MKNLNKFRADMRRRRVSRELLDKLMPYLDGSKPIGEIVSVLEKENWDQIAKICGGMFRWWESSEQEPFHNVHMAIQQRMLQPGDHFICGAILGMSQAWDAFLTRRLAEIGAETIWNQMESYLFHMSNLIGRPHVADSLIPDRLTPKGKSYTSCLRSAVKKVLAHNRRATWQSLSDFVMAGKVYASDRMEYELDRGQVLSCLNQLMPGNTEVANPMRLFMQLLYETRSGKSGAALSINELLEQLSDYSLIPCPHRFLWKCRNPVTPVERFFVMTMKLSVICVMSHPPYFKLVSSGPGDEPEYLEQSLAECTAWAEQRKNIQAELTTNGEALLVDIARGEKIGPNCLLYAYFKHKEEGECYAKHWTEMGVIPERPLDELGWHLSSEETVRAIGKEHPVFRPDPKMFWRITKYSTCCDACKERGFKF